MKKLILFSALTAITLFSCNQNNSSNTANDNSTIKPAKKITIANNSLILDYTDTEKGDTVLLFVHGWGINKTYWDAQVAHFKNKYRVITMDLAGYGKSGKNRNDWSVAAFSSDVLAVMTQLQLYNVILIGHSMSGDIVLDVARGSHVIGIVGVDNFKSVGIKEDEEAAAGYMQAIAAMKKNFKGTVKPYVEKMLFGPKTDTASKRRILNDILNTDSTVAVATMEAMHYDEVPALVNMRKKLYLISSDVTPTETKGFIENNIPFRIAYIKGSGHYPMIEQPAAFNTALESVLREIGDKNE